ncbi:amidohydrolase [Emergencia sp.]|uniref:amidohydrolase n=1 Tax=Emergencia sp. TaxID=1926557 RepID=UPI003AEF7E24
MKQYDSVYTNGKIFTADDEGLYADSMALQDGKIVWIGKGEALDLAGEDVIDLQGRTVLPGLIDSHMHPIMVAANLKQIVCLPPYIHSIEELTQAVRKVRQEQGPDRWILGWGYDEGKLQEGRTPTRYDLDAGASDVPVCIIRSCGHIRCVNSKALALGGIDENTVCPEGGRIVRDDRGVPTGVLEENARDLLAQYMPAEEEADIIENLTNLSEHLLSEGITAIADMGNMDDRDYFDIYENARKKGFAQRVGVFYMWDQFRHKPEFHFVQQRLSGEIPTRVCGIKIIADGGISGRTAWVNQPYLAGSGAEYGVSTCTEEDITSAIAFCKENKAQLSIHAMGQNSIDMAVNLIAEEEDWLDDRLPHARIEHASMPTENALAKSAAADIAFVTQPVFLYAEIERYLENLGIQWLQSTFPFREILRRGIRLAFSTDAPATPLADATNPFLCVETAVTRKAGDGTDCGRENAVDLETALKLYTREGAYVMGFADIGMLKKDYRADFIVLDRDIFSVPEQEIHLVQVAETYMDGELRYQKE